MILLFPYLQKCLILVAESVVFVFLQTQAGEKTITEESAIVLLIATECSF